MEIANEAIKLRCSQFGSLMSANLDAGRSSDVRRARATRYAASNKVIRHESAASMSTMPSHRSTKKAIEKIPIPNPADMKSFIHRSDLLVLSPGHPAETTRYPDKKASPSARTIFIYFVSSPASSKTPLPKSSTRRRFGGRLEGCD